MNFWHLPWLRHGQKESPRRPVRARNTHLSLEILEDRCMLSAAAALPVGPTLNWRAETFSIENTVVTKPTGSAVQLQTTTPNQGEGFGQDIGLNQVVANYPYNGAGYTVAIIDTGIDYNNPALGGGWGKRVVAGYNFVNNTSDPMDDNGHGTHVAGIIGSSNSTYTGIAPDVDFVALKVLDATGSGTFGNVDLALQWVAAHQKQYNIVAVNMSLGSGNYTIDPYTFLESDFSTLVTDGVFIAVASGNNYYGVSSQQGLAYPAISPQVVSVGAVWDGNFGAVSWVSGARDNSTAIDQITSFTQRSAALDLLAPGAMITSTYLNDTFVQMAGTSMASPVVAGSAVLIHEALDALGRSSQASQSFILKLMQTTGATIVDSETAADNVTNSGLRYKRLNLYAAISSLATVPSKPPTLATIPNQTMTAGVPLSITLAAGTSDGGVVTFSDQVANYSPAYQLGLQLGLSYAGSYFLSSIGKNEKWIIGANSQWYCLLPDGSLYRWVSNATLTLSPANLVATLTPAIYNDPTQLWTASATAPPPVTSTFAGNQLTLKCDPSFLGSFKVTVSASEGGASVSQSFIVTVSHPNTPPVLGNLAIQSQTSTTLVANVAASDADGNNLTLSAQAIPLSSQLYNLEQQYGFTYTGNYFTNIWGGNEKWLKGKNGQWYCLLPNGELRVAQNNLAYTLQPGNLIAMLDPFVYGDPSLLWNAKAPSTPQVTVALQGSKLTVTSLNGYHGSFYVEIAVSDGFTTTKKTYFVTI